jgi:hypothetical protein
MKLNIMSALCAFYVTPALAGVGLNDFYVANLSGDVYLVNGDTLSASSAFSFQGVGLFNEMLYAGNNEFYAMGINGLFRYDANSGMQENLVTLTDKYTGGTYWGSGLAMSPSDRVYFSIWSVTADHPGVVQFGVEYDPSNDDLTEVATFQTSQGTYIDHHFLDDHTLLSANYTSRQIRVNDADTGADIAQFELGYSVVSMFEQRGQIFTISDDGELYAFDALNGSSSLLGQISGFSGDLVGATIPAPAGVALLGMGGLICARRRR